MLIILYFYTLYDYFKIGYLVYPNYPFRSVPYNLYPKDLLYLP